MIAVCCSPICCFVCSWFVALNTIMSTDHQPCGAWPKNIDPCLLIRAAAADVAIVVVTITIFTLDVCW